MTKTRLPVILALAVTLLPALAEDWTTTDGKTYKNVTVISHDAKIVTISSSEGTATFPIALLDKDLQKRVQGDNATTNDWTVNGKDYHNVTVGKVEPDLVHITYDGGTGTVMLSDLTPELQKRFNYDPKAAAQASQQKAAAQAQAEADMAKQAQKPHFEVDPNVSVKTDPTDLETVFKESTPLRLDPGSEINFAVIKKPDGSIRFLVQRITSFPVGSDDFGNAGTAVLRLGSDIIEGSTFNRSIGNELQLVSQFNLTEDQAKAFIKSDKVFTKLENVNYDLVIDGTGFTNVYTTFISYYGGVGDQASSQAQATANAADPVVPQAQPTPAIDPNFVSSPACQGTLNGFLNMPWASSMEAVRKGMQSQGGFIETTSTTPHNLIFKGGTFANLAVQEIQLHFFHDQLDMALVILKPTDNNAQTLDNLRSALTQKYGNWSGTTTAMLWKFQDTNTIMVTNKSGSIHLGYTDTDLFNAGMTESSTGINPSNL